jgi:hypothetical protein
MAIFRHLLRTNEATTEYFGGRNSLGTALAE